MKADSQKQEKVLFFKNLLLEVIRICSERSTLSIEHLIFLNEHLDEEDEKVDTFEAKNKYAYNVALRSAKL